MDRSSLISYWVRPSLRRMDHWFMNQKSLEGAHHCINNKAMEDDEKIEFWPVRPMDLL